MANSPTQSPAAEPAESKAVSWNAFLSIYLPALVLALGAGMALPAIPALAKSFHVSFFLASGVVTAFVVGNVAGSIPTGWLIDRFGRRRIMLIGPLLTSLMAFAVLFAHTFPEILLFRFVDGWAAQMWLMGRITRISSGAQANQRGRQVSWMYGMDSFGRLSGPLAGGFIAAAWGIRSPFAAYGTLALLALIPSFMFIQEDAPRKRANQAKGQARKLSIWEIVVPRLAFFGVAGFAGMARGPSQSGLMHLYAAYTYGLDPRAIGILATAASCITLPIGFIAGWMMDRFGRKHTMVPGFFGVTIAMSLIAVTAFLHLGLPWYVAVFLLGMASQGLTGGSIQTVGTDVAPPEARGFFLGLWIFTGRLGTAISPIVFAFLADRLGYGSSFIYVACAALAVALLLVFFVPETSEHAAEAIPVSESPATPEHTHTPASDPAAVS